MKNLLNPLLLCLVALMSAVVSFCFMICHGIDHIDSSFLCADLMGMRPENMGGSRVNYRFTRIVKFLTKPILPKKRTAATTLKDLVTATGSFIMKNGA